MKMVFGILLVVAGIALGLYVGVWLMFIGGIVDVIEQVRAPELSAMGVAIGIGKTVFAGVAGWLVAIIIIVPGAAIAQSA
jgi:hypothetical protein